MNLTQKEGAKNINDDITLGIKSTPRSLCHKKIYSDV